MTGWGVEALQRLSTHRWVGVGPPSLPRLHRAYGWPVERGTPSEADPRSPDGLWKDGGSSSSISIGTVTMLGGGFPGIRRLEKSCWATCWIRGRAKLAKECGGGAGKGEGYSDARTGVPHIAHRVSRGGGTQIVSRLFEAHLPHTQCF